MIRAFYTDKPRIVEILKLSFNENKSVNYIIKQDSKREKRLQKLMEYAFDICYHFGNVFLTDDKKGCALILLPDKKKTTLESIFLDLKFILSSIGLSNVIKAMNREAKIKNLQPKELLYYLWFIGVNQDDQNKGIGSVLLSEVIDESISEQRTICLETSTLKNIPWYEKFGFKIYNELDLGYKLYFLKRE